MSACLDCRRFHSELVYPSATKPPYNCSRHHVIVSPGAKPCASFDPKVRDNAQRLFTDGTTRRGQR